MKDVLLGLILLLIWVFIWILLNVKFSIDFWLWDLFWNWIKSGFENSIQAPSNIMNEAWNMMWF
jgi:hypothetical protein